MKNTFLIALIGLISFASASQSRAEISQSITDRLLDSTQDARASELTHIACTDKQGLLNLRMKMVEKIQVVNEQHKALIVEMEATQEDTQFYFRKSNLKGHASRKNHEAVLLVQRLGFIDQALNRCQ